MTARIRGPGNGGDDDVIQEIAAAEMNLKEGANGSSCALGDLE
jgi:hypothetical protein